MHFLGYTLGDPSIPLPEPTPELFAKMDVLVNDARAAGVLLATGGVAPSATTQISLSEDGEMTVVDGPFAEAKELIGGWALMQTDTREEAIEWGKRFLRLGGPGTTNLREVFVMQDEDFAPPA